MSPNRLIVVMYCEQYILVRTIEAILLKCVHNYLTVPSEVAGTDSVTGITICVCSFNTAIFLLISVSLRGALTVAEPKYVTPVNTTVPSSSSIGLSMFPAKDLSICQSNLN